MTAMEIPQSTFPLQKVEAGATAWDSTLNSRYSEESKNSSHNLVDEALQFMHKHPLLVAAAAVTSVVIGRRTIPSMAELAAESRQPISSEALPLSADSRPANIFGLLQQSDSNLASIATKLPADSTPLFKLSDTTMSVSNSDHWRLLLEAGAHDPYNAEVIRQANRWATLAEERLATGSGLSKQSFDGLSIPSVADKPVSHESVKLVLMSDWKHAPKYFY